MTGVFICPVDDESAAFGPALEIGCALGTVLPFISDAGEAEVEAEDGAARGESVRAGRGGAGVRKGRGGRSRLRHVRRHRSGW